MATEVTQDAPPTAVALGPLRTQIHTQALALGFADIGVTGIDLTEDEAWLERWLALGRQGDMDYMARHGRKRTRPETLVPGTIRVISARMDYWPDQAAPAWDVLRDARRAYISRYAVGRDYHKLMRKRLKHLAEAIEAQVGPIGYRVFSDSAPVLEKALARNAGLGWIGKHAILINKKAGSYFFLGEIYTDLPLPIDAPASAHCGSCSACITACPTGAIVGPHEVDARRCISYLTIESKEAIPLELRAKLGNRVFGCDDCQLVCPWNKFAHPAATPDFQPRHGLDSASLAELFLWTEEEWDERTQGSAIRRAGFEGWLRNIAVALGNAPSDDVIIHALESRRNHSSVLVREHVEWALAEHARKHA